MLSRRVQQIGFSPTLRISALAQQRRSEGVDVLDFAAGQPDFNTPERIKQAGIAAIENNETRYTPNPGTVALRQAIVDKLARDNGLEYGLDQIVVSPGAKASLYFALMALLDPGDRVLVPTPYWVSYPEQIGLCGAEAVYVETSLADGFKVTPEQLVAAGSAGSKLVILNYPNNPTGAAYTPSELEALAACCVEQDLWVVADEIYEKLLFDGLEFRSIASFGEAIRRRTVLINGVSKAYAMTGWRIGYAAGPKEVLAAMGRLQSHATSNAASVSQAASVEALQPDNAELAHMREQFQRRRDLLLAGLRGMDGVACNKAGGAFYLFPDVSGLFGKRWEKGTLESGSDVAEFLLEKASMAVVPGEGFGAPRHIRLSYALATDRVEEGVRRMAGAIAGLS